MIVSLSCMGTTHISIVLCFLTFCFSYLLLHNKSPQNLVAVKIIPTDDLSVCDSGIWAQLSWAPSSLYQSWGCCHLKAQLGMALLPSSLVWLLEGLRKFTSKLTHVVLGRIWIFMGCWTKGLNSSLAVAQRPASVPCSMAHSMGQLTTRQPDLSE